MNRTLLVLVLVAVVLAVVYFGVGTANATAATAPGMPKPGPLVTPPSPFGANPPAATAAGIDCSNPQFVNAPECQRDLLGPLKSAGWFDELAGTVPIRPGSPVVPHGTSPAAAPPPVPTVASSRGGAHSIASHSLIQRLIGGQPA